MSEVIVLKKIRSDIPPFIQDEMITEDKAYIVLWTGNYKVQCIGGGGAGNGGRVTTTSTGGSFGQTTYWASSGAGGGSGFKNEAILLLNRGEVIRITIGSSGSYETGSSNNTAKAGGTTAFGTYLSANGGEGGMTLYGFGPGGVRTSNGGNGFNKGQNGKIINQRTMGHTPPPGFYQNVNLIGSTGGWLYLSNDNSIVNYENGLRLHYGEGGNGGNMIGRSAGNGTSGNSGCVLISFID